jgi:hypothetical protein
VVMGTGGLIMMMVMIVKAVSMNVVVRHGVSLAPSGHKSAP